ncbi:MAG: energy-coupling factor transporter transmembrane protein EcfT [Spirochaetaceae bacterium]|jgi:cobalt/nickel transport system permease protein|nr:energy-coupling factor transporter transmembrane protein EcfT [Spirochaetaceae bacterium]
MILYRKIRGIDQLELLARGDSPVHRLHPGAKIIVLAVYTGVLVSFSPLAVSGMVPFVLYPAVLMPLSETPWRIFFPRLLAALPFALLGALSCLLAYRDTAFFLGPLRISTGMVSFVSIFLRTCLTVAGALILIATTSYGGINRQLVRMGMPRILCLQFIMTWRYVSVLLGEAASMGAAYSLRSGKERIRMQDMGGFLGSLLIRSVDRADRVYRAMRCRGFDGVYRQKREPQFRPVDFLYVILLSAAALVLRFFNLSLFAGGLFSVPAAP